jgi:hypothetical protein
MSCISRFYTQVDMLFGAGVGIGFCSLDPVRTWTEIYSAQSETRQFSQTSILSYFHPGNQHPSPSFSCPLLLTHASPHFTFRSSPYYRFSVFRTLAFNGTDPTGTAMCLDGLIITNILRPEYKRMLWMSSATKWRIKWKKNGRISSCVVVASWNLNLFLLRT